MKRTLVDFDFNLERKQFRILKYTLDTESGELITHDPVEIGDTPSRALYEAKKIVTEKLMGLNMLKNGGK